MDSEISHRHRRSCSPSGDVDCNLTDDLLFEILCRLSSKVVSRFKLVCKHWYSLISSHCFVTLFNRRRNEEASSPAEYSLMFQFQRLSDRECNDYYSSVFHCGSGGALQRVHRLDLSFVPTSSQTSKIAVNASCGDLILCSNEDILEPQIKQFYVCNPRNNQCLALPVLSLPPNRCMSNYNLGLLYLACHPEKFTVVLIGIGRTVEPTFSIEVILFSSEEGRWRERVISSPKKIGFQPNGFKNLAKFKKLVPYKGKLHWVNYPYVLVYDPYNDPEKISRVIRMQRDNSFVGVRSAGVLQDRIHIAYTNFEYPKFHCVLELEDYGMGKWRVVKKVMETDLNDGCGYALHDGNALCRRRNCCCSWLEKLEQSNGVAVDEDQKCELAHFHHDLSLLFPVSINQIDFNWLPTPLPYMIWPHS